MSPRALVLALLLAPPASAAAPEAARPAPRRPAPAVPAPLEPAAPPRRVPGATEELRRLRAGLGGRVVARARAETARLRAALEGAAAKAALDRYAATLRQERAQLRQDRERAMDEMTAAAEGSRERELWWTAVQADTVMLEDYARALAELDAARAERAPRSRAAAASPRGG